MKKILTVALALALVLCVFAGCEKKETVLKDTDEFIVLSPEDSFAGKSLEEFMASVKAEGKLDYSINGQKMITSINGIENAADYSSCWMLYTDDAENSNTAWGVITYKDKAYGSATLGASDLVIAKGCVYIWVYTTF